MIRLHELEITEFRGIRKTNIKLGGESVLVHGPNGTGKSGVVDAIDFALTGSIARLRGAGTGNVNVKEHAPHVLQRDNPAAASVTLTFQTSDGLQGKLTRTVRDRESYTLEPNTPELETAIAEAAEHTELILTRRDILKFILAQPGDRSKAVQALLKLDSLEGIRAALRTTKTQLTKEKNTADERVAAAGPELAALLGGTTTTAGELLAAANIRRRLLRIPELAESNLASGPDWVPLDDGVSRDAGGGPDRAGAVRVAQELAATSTAVGVRVEELAGELDTALRELGDVTAAQTALARRSLVVAALDRVAGAECPVCDLSWESEQALRDHLKAKLAASEHAGSVQDRISRASAGLTAQLELLHRKVLSGAEAATALLAGTSHPEAMRDWAEQLAHLRRVLTDEPASTVSRAQQTGDPARSLTATTSQTSAAMEALAAAAQALPDQSDAHAAASWLARAQERWAQLQRALAGQQAATEHSRVADLLYATYCAALDAALEELYRSIETQFSAYYKRINEGDEDAFRAELAPAAGRLDLSVDFYQQGLFPPGAYHSEGHQDGMGLALYLALLEHLLGDELSFVVLDDVITSVDIAHRRKICELVLERFPSVQFVITTHEKTWAKTIVQLGLVKRSNVVEFQAWNVDTGPIRAETGDVFARIDEQLAKGAVNTAAPMLRQLLETRMRTHAEDFGAQVPYREDGRYDLGVLLTAVGMRYGRLLEKAKKAAKKHNDTEQTDKVAWLEAVWSQTLKGYKVEDWAINVMTHYNPSYDVTAVEFASTVKAARDLLALFECAGCQNLLRTEGFPDATTLRCRCNKFNLNLQE